MAPMSRDSAVDLESEPLDYRFVLQNHWQSTQRHPPVRPGAIQRSPPESS